MKASGGGFQMELNRWELRYGSTIRGQMMVRSYWLVGALFVVLIGGCAQPQEKQAPVQVQVHVHNDHVGTTYNGNVAVGPGLAVQWQELSIVSMADGLQLQDVVINRGNCRIPPDQDHFPRRLAMGRHLDLQLYQCDVVEVTVRTDQGEWTGQFN